MKIERDFFQTGAHCYYEWIVTVGGRVFSYRHCFDPTIPQPPLDHIERNAQWAIAEKLRKELFGGRCL